MRTRPHHGFTLIELMIVVAVIGILAAIVLPSYQQHVLRTRRAVAAGCLMELAQHMERAYTTSMTYSGATLPNTTCRSDLANSYSFAFATGEPTATTFKIVATPTGAQTSDTACAAISLTQSGVKASSGTLPTTDPTCWK